MRFLHVAALAAFVSMLAACGGGGASSPAVMPPPAGSGPTPVPPTPTPPALPSSLTPAVGSVSGLDNTFTPNDGDTSAGGQGQTVDGIPCNNMTTVYHVHAFVGLIQNGEEIALPDAIGMQNPGPETNGEHETASCFYYVHTHDASGIVHLEDTSTTPETVAIHTLGELFAIWGEPLSGWTTIYTSGQVPRGVTPETVSNSTYSLYSGTPSSLPLYAHEVIWLESGSPVYTGSQLPSVNFTY